MDPQHQSKVLIVDNNQCALEAFEQVFARVGFDTRTTWSGREALELLGSQEFDVLLVDDYLPDLHAGEFLNRVSQLPVQPWIVVMQASMPTTGDLLRYASLGAFSVVRKHHLAEVCKAVSSCCVAEPLARTLIN